MVPLPLQMDAVDNRLDGPSLLKPGGQNLQKEVRLINPEDSFPLHLILNELIYSISGFLFAW